jgi:hypothetical protein
VRSSRRLWIVLQNLRAIVFVIAWMVFAGGVAANEPSTFETTLPKIFAGEFRWYGDSIAQKVHIMINLTRRQDDSQRIELIGCGRYDAAGRVTNIGVRMIIDPRTREIEIWEFDPRGPASFTTDGSHKGKLADDSQGIDAEWTTRSTGQKGRLLLRAAAAFTCTLEAV